MEDINVANFDTDGDGVPDVDDNCIDVSSLGQQYFESEGFGDYCDLDDDNDRLPEDYELQDGLNSKDPADALIDSDGDGIDNFHEYMASTDPLKSNSAISEAS